MAIGHQVIERPGDFGSRPRRSSVYGFLGLRPVYAQHTQAEEDLLARYAAGRKSLAEIGVAEGASAAVLRRCAAPDATIFLIDPFIPGRLPLSLERFIARRYVGAVANGRVEWIERFSHQAVETWKTPLDFLFIDGDHSYEACLRDWSQWSPFVVAGGIVAFHDARVFEGGWTSADWGPVRVIADVFGSGKADGWSVVGGVDSLVVVERAGTADNIPCAA